MIVEIAIAKSEMKFPIFKQKLKFLAHRKRKRFSGGPRSLPKPPPISQLKRTGEAFLQIGPCFEVAPKLIKCRECRDQRSKNGNFCRFEAFRKLRYANDYYYYYDYYDYYVRCCEKKNNCELILTGIVLVGGFSLHQIHKIWPHRKRWLLRSNKRSN